MPTSETAIAQRDTFAAIDLGSNSFHMVVARVVDGQLSLVDRLKDMVQLAAGLDEDRVLSEEAQARALTCLERFGQRVRNLPADHVRAVGTNTLRSAHNAEKFLQKAEEALGQSIEVISGIEEARLIYSGVAQGLGGADGRRLVVDIGGGSSELIVGRGADPIDLESLYVGCVTMTKRHFADGKISAKRFRRAELSALQELERLQGRFKRLSWDTTVGTSGTIRTAGAVIAQEGWARQGLITADALKKLRDAIVDAGNISSLGLSGLNEARGAVFPGGVAILCAVFEAFDIEQMQIGESALREGLLSDLLGRYRHEDVRATTVNALMERYHVDREQAARVEATLLRLLPQVAEQWGLRPERSQDLCSWAARLHEIGLDIAHSHYHKHGAYILENADMPGFSRQEQRWLAILVRAHRRKFPVNLISELPGKARLLEHLAVLLRVAVVLHRSRSSDLPQIRVTASPRALELKFPSGWLDEHPLTQADLQEESDFLKEAAFELRAS